MSYDDNGRDDSDDALPDNYDDMVVVSPEDEDDDDTVNGSPVERIERDLPQKVHRNFVASSDDHPLVETAGTKEALLSNVPVDIQQVVAQGLYEEDDVFFREYIQNAIAACVREGRRVVRNIYGDGALYRYVSHEHPSLDGERQIKLPKNARDILDLAREHGYVPNIEIEVNYDESKLIVRDNGIGMTTGEVIEVWKEPAQSGSGRDQASAGNKGIGSLTWVNIAGEDGAMIVRTATRREQTADGQPVPQRDRDGFSFFTFFGGVVPIDNEVEDGFYGTEFEIPVPDSHDMTTFKDKAAKYCDILPVEVTWYETENGITEDDEFEASAPTDQYDREPPISIERPGEFSVYLGPAELVPKGHGDDDTWLLDNPIDRNLSTYNPDQTLDTLWNDHVVIHNERGLIIEGPNRGKRYTAMDDGALAGDIDDISDPEMPMPDIPLPTPVSSRDSLRRDDAHKRFFEYLDHVAKKAEVDGVEGFINDYLDTNTPQAGLEQMRRDPNASYSLLRKMSKRHGSYRTPKENGRLYDWLTSTEQFDIADTAPVLPPGHEDNPSNRDEKVAKRKHEKWSHITALVNLHKTVSRTTGVDNGDPNNKENRSEVRLGKLLIDEQRHPIFIGSTLNKDRVRVIFNTYPNALVFKPSGPYSTWRQRPFDINLVKNVPFTQDEADEMDRDWDVPDGVDTRHGKTASDSTDTDTPTGMQKPLKIRTTSNSAVDLQATADELVDALDGTPFGNIIPGLKHRYLLVFPTTHDHFNISDYWHLTGSVAMVRATKTVSERLLHYPQVFTVDDYTRMLMDASFETYDPWTRTWQTESVLDITGAAEDGDRKYIAVNAQDDDFWRLVQAERIPGTTGSHDDGALEVIRTNTLNKVASECYSTSTIDADDPDEPWRLIKWTDEGRDEYRARRLWRTYVDLDTKFSAGDEVYYDIQTLKAQSKPYVTWGYSHSLGSVSRIIERSKYPAWGQDSDAWDRLNKTYRGPNNREKAMYRAVREAGVDPYDHGSDRLERVLVELFDHCPDTDADTDADTSADSGDGDA